MGGVKDDWIRSDELLAEQLGITPEELDEMDYELDAETSEDGLIYGYYMQFSEECPLYILDKISGLEDGNIVRLPPGTFDYARYEYDVQFAAVSANDAPTTTFLDEINNLKQLIDLPVEPPVQDILFRQVFIHVIGLMETFLSDTFINLTLNEDIFFRNFIRTHPAFREQKFELRDIFDESAKLRDTAKRVMLDMIYHKLPEVREMYRATFDIQFPAIKTMIAYVRDRHDLVHRNGKRKDGSILVIDKPLLLAVVSDATAFVEAISEAVSYVQNDIPF